jgi:hypothetical protein
MQRLITTFVLVGLLSACASYRNDIMEPWIGASQEELVMRWGYPQSANDLIKINDTTSVFTYRSYRSLGHGPWRNFGGGPSLCAVSFTLKNSVVANYRYEGENCPKIKRQ